MTVAILPEHTDAIDSVTSDSDRRLVRTSSASLTAAATANLGRLLRQRERDKLRAGGRCTPNAHDDELPPVVRIRHWQTHLRSR